MDNLTQGLITAFLAVIFYNIIRWYRKESYWKRQGVYEADQTWQEFFDIARKKIHVSDAAFAQSKRVPKELSFYGSYLT